MITFIKTKHSIDELEDDTPELAVIDAVDEEVC
jgi:hypothetical protein